MSDLTELKNSLEKLNTDLMESVSDPTESKPLENEFSCRLNSPGKYMSFARKNCYKKSNGKCIDYIFGIKEGKSEVQSLRYKKKVWDKSAARSHCSGRGGSFGV